MFREQLADYRLFPYRLTRPLSFAIPVVEAATAALLLIDSTRRIGAVLGLVLTAAFAVAVWFPWHQGREVACACFGGESELDTVALHTFVRALLLACFAALAAFPERQTLMHDVPAAVVLAALLVLATEVTRVATNLRESAAAAAGIAMDSGTRRAA